VYYYSSRCFCANASQVLVKDELATYYCESMCDPHIYTFDGEWVECFYLNYNKVHTHTHTLLTALCPWLPGWAGTRKVKPIWILLKQETVGGSGIRWAICKSAPRSRQIIMPAPHCSVFTGRMPFFSPNQQRQSTEGKITTKYTHRISLICVSLLFETAKTVKITYDS